MARHVDVQSAGSPESPRSVVSSDVWDRERAEAYDAEEAEMMSAPWAVDPVVDRLVHLAGPGPVLEFAIGTGRIGIPLMQRGIHVTGIELSAPMVSCLRAKVSETDLPVAIGDMATTRVAGEFSLVYLVWNSFSNLWSQEAQIECFRNASRHLTSGGRFVIELFVPPLRRLPPGQIAVPFEVSEAHTGFDTLDLATQTLRSHHYRRQADGTMKYTVGTFRYAWPAECDLMAKLAGMELEDRFQDWQGRPFSCDSESHVSVWRKR
jgi:SAM-dependent methyltransferase